MTRARRPARPRCRRRNAWLYAAASLLAAAFLGPAPAAQAQEGRIFEAMGVGWVWGETRWTLFEGRWLVATEMRIASDATRQVNGMALIAALCRATLEAMPDAPAPAPPAADLHRIDLTVTNADGQSAFGTAVPVSVEDGQCAVRTEGRQEFRVTYPGALAGWSFVGATLSQSEAGNRLQYMFRPADPAAPPGAFDYALGCEAVTRDPTVQGMTAALREKIRAAGLAFAEDEILVVTMLKPDPDAAQGVFAGNVYNVADGRCTER